VVEVNDSADGASSRRNERRLVGTGASITTVSQASSALAGGLAAVVIGRLEGPDGLGVYAVVVATVAILTIVSSLGIESGALYHVSGNRWRPARAARQLQVAALALGIGGLAIGMAIYGVAKEWLFAGIDASTFLIGLAAIPFALSWLFGSAVALAEERYERSALAPASQAVALVVLITVVTPMKGVPGAITAYTASHALTAGWVAVIAFGQGSRDARGWLRSTPSDLWAASRFGWKLTLSAILATLNRRADLLILNASASHAAVGWYGVALSVTELQLLLPSSLSRVVVPRVSSLDSAGADPERSFVIAKSVRHGVVVSVVGAGLMAVGLLFVPLVFGSSFEPAVALGWILVPGVAAYGLSSVFSATIVGSGHPGYLLRAAVIVTPVTLVLYLALIPPFEATGAAVASTISYCGTLVLVWLYFRRASGVYGVHPLLPGRAEIFDYLHLRRSVIRDVRDR
jgi:O-antigen/teichoic acid export membrane protein